MYGAKSMPHNRLENAYYSYYYKVRKPKTKNTGEPRNSSVKSTAQWLPGSRPEPYPSDTHVAGLTHTHHGREIATRGSSKKATKFALPPTSMDCIQPHANLMNTSPVRFILFPAHNDNTQKILDIDKLRLRRLAYLRGGIGYIQFQKSIAWIINNKKISLVWSHQGSDHHLDFTTPLRMCMWQSSRNRTPIFLQQHTTPILLTR